MRRNTHTSKNNRYSGANVPMTQTIDPRGWYMNSGDSRAAATVPDTPKIVRRNREATQKFIDPRNKTAVVAKDTARQKPGVLAAAGAALLVLLVVVLRRRRG